VHGLEEMLWWWTEATWYGRFGVQVEWGWVPHQGGRRDRGLVVNWAQPVNGDKIGHQEDGTPYILIDSSPDDELKKYSNPSVITSTVNRALALRGAWRERFIIHQCLREDRDYFALDQQDAVHGVGVRSEAFWWNWIKLGWLANITDFFERVGLGVTIWTYPR